MEYENKFSSDAKGSLGVTLGAIGTGLGFLNNGGLGNLFNANGGCSDNHCVNRYEMKMQQELAAKDSKIALLESNIYVDSKVDSKVAEVYERLNNKISCIEGQIAQQAVYNATMNGTLNCINGQIAELMALTGRVVKNSSVCPGWGNVTITPETATTT